MGFAFTVPFNGDERLINNALERYGEKIDSFYGSCKNEIFGSSRATGNSDIETLERIIKKLKNRDILFNYVINSQTSLNEEFLDENIEKFLYFIKTLKSIGVDIVTLSNLFLINLVRDNFPELKISASVNLGIKSVDEIKYITELGIYEATLHYDVIKDFKALKNIRKNTDIKLKLIANDIFIKNCPWQKGHIRMQSSYSRNKEKHSKYFSYYRNKCINLRNIYPEEIFKSMWIHPIHISEYIDIGYNHFKLIDRAASTEWILKVLDIYANFKNINNFELFLGTYGRESNMEKLINKFTREEYIYDEDRLNAIPMIKQLDKSKKFNLWFDENHKKDCSSCMNCSSISDKYLYYPEEQRNQFIENNKIYQSNITKRNFIENLNNSDYKNNKKYF